MGHLLRPLRTLGVVRRRAGSPGFRRGAGEVAVQHADWNRAFPLTCRPGGPGNQRGKHHAEQHDDQADDREATGEHVRTPSFSRQEWGGRAEPALRRPFMSRSRCTAGNGGRLPGHAVTRVLDRLAGSNLRGRPGSRPSASAHRVAVGAMLQPSARRLIFGGVATVSLCPRKPGIMTVRFVSRVRPIWP